VRAFELTLGWSSRELSVSLFETLIGTYNPAFSKGLGGLESGYAKLSTNRKTLRSKISFHDFSYVPGLAVTGTLANGVGHLLLSGPHVVYGSLTAPRANQFTGRLDGVAVHFALTQAQLAALAS